MSEERVAPAKQEEKKQPMKATVVNCSALNVRNKPSKDAIILDRFIKGLEVRVLSWNPKGWARVSNGRVSGFCMAEYLERKDDV